MDPQEILVFEFFGSAVKVNQRTGQVSRIKGTAENLFHGHAVQSEDGKIIWTTEHQPGPRRNRVRGRRIEDLSLIDETIGFAGGHHLVRLPGSPVLVSGGSTPEKKHFLSFYDSEEMKLLQTLPMEEVMGHLLAFSPSEIIGVSNSVKMTENETQRLSALLKMNQHPTRLTGELDLTGEAPLVYANLKGEIKSFWEEGRKDIFRFGFGLDLIPGSPGRYITGHHHSNTVILWDHFKIVKVFKIPEPFGILVSRDGSEFVVLTKGALETYSLSTFERTNRIRYERPVSVLSRYA